MSSASHVSQFLRPADDLNTANSAWILYVGANVTRLRTTTCSLYGKSIAIRIFLSKLLKIWPEQCGWEWWGYIQYMPYLASWRHRRCSGLVVLISLKIFLWTKFLFVLYRRKIEIQIITGNIFVEKVALSSVTVCSCTMLKWLHFWIYLFLISDTVDSACCHWFRPHCDLDPYTAPTDLWCCPLSLALCLEKKSV
jgi:hypothetical protein